MDTANVYDVHCHIQGTSESLKTLESEPAKMMVFSAQGTDYDDWKSVIELKEKYPDQIIPGFGIHPWFIEKVISGAVPESWETELCSLISKYNGILGECGLDKVAKNPKTGQVYPFAPQVDLLKKQLVIAHNMDVPVSLHCVRAFGEMAAVLHDMERNGTQLPPRIMLHSYSGSPDMLSQMFFRGELGKRMYVSFSSAHNGRNRKKSLDCIRVIPEDRILIESDLHDVEGSSRALDDIAEMVAEGRKWSIHQTRQILAKNSRQFFGIAEK